jgi:hypothetical protein
MTRPKPRDQLKVRGLPPDQRRAVAQCIVDGTPLKVVAANWGISRAQVHDIFAEHLEYRIVWKEQRNEEAQADRRPQETAAEVHAAQVQASGQQLGPVPRVR